LNVTYIDGTEGFSPSRVSDKATGGILSSLTHIPRHLAKKGHNVTVKSKYSVRETRDGVKYSTLFDPVTTADVIVFNRNVLNNDLVRQAKATGARVIWWLHDIVDPRYLVDDAFRHVDSIVSLSDYCTRTYSEFYGISPNLFTKIPNGVDKTVFYPGKWEHRRNNLFIYASAPVKGMKPLGFTINNLKRHDPKAELRIYGSQKLHDQKDDALVKFILKRAEEDGATILDPVPQAELAQVMREATALLMPNSYPEICSNLLLQARASGLPVIATPTGSIPEFLTDGVNGFITESTPLDLYFWWKEFAKLAVSLSQNTEWQQHLSENGPKGVLSWEDVGDMWDKLILGRN
jgi:glycosyltransferase involved in cell wall biosynthesis